MFNIKILNILKKLFYLRLILNKFRIMENSISLFTSILISNPKMLLDIKKYTIRILDILVRDMPIYFIIIKKIKIKI